MKAYITRVPLQTTPRLIQDVALLLDTAELGTELPHFLLRLEQLVRTLLFLARPYGACPLVETVGRRAESVSIFLDRASLLGHLTDRFILECRGSEGDVRA